MADVDGRNDSQVAEDALGTSLLDDGVDNEAVLADVEEGEDARESTESVLARLESDDPGAARVVGAMQKQMSRMQNEWRGLQGELLQTLTALRTQPESEEAAEQTPLPEGVTPEHLDLFQKMAEHFGYVPREELDTREVEQEVESHAEADMKKGVELYGDAFGALAEDGSVQVKEEVLERLRQAHDRIFDPKRGLTLLDLYQMEFGPPQQRIAPQPPARRVPRAGVARRSTGGGREIQIYDSKRGDSREDVFNRAWALARRELG